MFGNNKKPQTYQPVSGPVDTLISQHCTIQGNLQAIGQAIIGEHGLVMGDVHSTDLLVFGRLEGNVRAKAVQLKPTARILGNIETETLEVEPGAFYQGSVTMLGAQAVAPADPALLTHSAE